MTAPHRKEKGASSGSNLPCIWMKAGLVAYKLCDRDFDCEGCPFDAAMSGAMPRHAPGRRPPAGAFRADRRYHPAHTWVQARRGGRLRCGIDAFAARLLTGLDGVILPATGSRLWQDRTGTWIATRNDLVALRSPVSGVVVRRNESLRSWPALATAAPYDDGWLLEVAPEGDDERPLLSADEMEARTVAQRERLREEVVRYVHRPEVGPTLPDGGEPSADLRALLGRRRFLKLVRSFLDVD